MRARNYLLILGKSEKSMVFVCVLERRERERERETTKKMLQNAQNSSSFFPVLGGLGYL